MWAGMLYTQYVLAKDADAAVILQVSVGILAVSGNVLNIIVR